MEVMQVAKIHNLRNFASEIFFFYICERQFIYIYLYIYMSQKDKILHRRNQSTIVVQIFAECENSQPAKFHRLRNFYIFALCSKN